MFTSPYPRIDVPDITVYDSLFGSLTENHATRVALIDGGTGAETTYGQLRWHVDAVAGALAERGVGPGTVLGLLCPNVPAFATIFHGVLRAGATITTVNSLYTAREIATQLQDAEASWLITVSPLLPAALEAASLAGVATQRVIVLDGAEGHEGLSSLLADALPAPPSPSIRPPT